MENCATSLVRREMEMKTLHDTVTYPLDWLKSHRMRTPHVGEDAEDGKYRALLGGVYEDTSTSENNLSSSGKAEQVNPV